MDFGHGEPEEMAAGAGLRHGWDQPGTVVRNEYLAADEGIDDGVERGCRFHTVIPTVF